MDPKPDVAGALPKPPPEPGVEARKPDPKGVEGLLEPTWLPNKGPPPKIKSN